SDLAAPYCPESDAVHSRDGRNLAPEQGGWVRPLIRSSALFQREGGDFRATIAVRRRAADLRMLVGLLRRKYKKASGLLGRCYTRGALIAILQDRRADAVICSNRD